MVGGVGDGQIAIRPEPVGEEVVEHAAVLVAEQRVLRAALGELGHVVADEPLEQGAGARAAGLDLAHVADVEDARALAHGGVLGTDPGGYWTGISQPAKGTRRAPAATCRSCNGVRLRVSVSAAIGATRP